MIISPHGLPTINIWHAVNNAYKCTDQAYMFSQTEHDCNLYLQKLYWERNPEIKCFAPNFILPIKNIMLIREDLVGADLEANVTSSNTVPFRIFNHGGYTMGGEVVENIGMPMTTSHTPLLRPEVWAPNWGSRIGTDIAGRWSLTRSYFPISTLTIGRIGNNGSVVELTPDHLNDFRLTEVAMLRLQFDETRQIHGILFYRPRLGRSGTSGAEHSIQVLRLPDYSDMFEKVFDLREAKDYSEPDEETCQVWSNHNYVGGVPCVANFDAPVSTREIFFRWSGQLTHFQLLDSPIIRPEAWWLADHPEMTYHWQFLEDKILTTDPSMIGDEHDSGQSKYLFVGDISTGIRFRHPLGRDVGASNEYDYNNSNPYRDIDYYSAQCLNFFGDEYEADVVGDIWTLRNFGMRYGELDFDTNWYNPNLETRIEENQGWNRVIYSTRDVGDNRFYVANKILLKWYYAPETNTWKSNHTRPSTHDQMRLIIELPEVQTVRGCINPMSVPATFNKPVFYTPARSSGTLSPTDEIRFSPGLYEDYIVPWRVLIEGRANNHVRTKWELMDEFTLEHCSARAHTYFSYPRRVKYIRITIQDWYGNSLLDEMRKDFVYGSTVLQGHYGKYSALAPSASDVVLRCVTDNIGTFLETSGYERLQAEWRRWKERTIQSMWKGIYIPPFLFFGDNGELR